MAGFSAYAFGGGDQVYPPDDSGNLTFVSNRYGGYVIAVDVELNSFSFYGVGRGTNLCFLEAANNADDDYEFWGGDVSGRWLLSMWCGDDGVDTDQGFLGAFQNVTQIQQNAVGAADGRASSAAATSNSVNAAARQIHGAHKIVEVIRHVQAARRVDRDVDWPVKRRSSSGAVNAPTTYAACAAGERRDAAGRNVDDADKMVEHVCDI
jgi:hypothetical protein